MSAPSLTSTRLAIADLRDSWAAWLAVSLTFVVTSAAISLSALALNTATIAKSQGSLGKEGGQLLTGDASLNLILCSMVAIAVISASTSLVVASRRGAVARLLLATRSVTWHRARNTVAARAERLVRSVVPVIFAVGLLFGLMAFSATL